MSDDSDDIAEVVPRARLRPNALQWTDAGGAEHSLLLDDLDWLHPMIRVQFERRFKVPSDVLLPGSLEPCMYEWLLWCRWKAATTWHGLGVEFDTWVAFGPMVVYDAAFDDRDAFDDDDADADPKDRRRPEAGS